MVRGLHLCRALGHAGRYQAGGALGIEGTSSLASLWRFTSDVQPVGLKGTYHYWKYIYI